MRIVFSSPEEFLDELSESTVKGNVCRVNVEMEWDQEEQVSCHYNIWLSAIIADKDNGDSLCEFARRVEEKDTAEAIYDDVEARCKSFDVKVRPGRIELY